MWVRMKNDTFEPRLYLARFMKTIVLLFLLSTIIFNTSAQSTGVGIGTTSPNSSAALEIKSTTQGLLLPRLTFAQRSLIVNPAAGLLIWCSDCGPSGEMQVFNGTSWTTTCGEQATKPELLFDTVLICSQTWMKKNLSLSRYKNGDMIPEVKDNLTWNSLTTGAWCWYNNDSANFWRYGKLYNWYAVNDARGIAPDGWHVPSAAEFTNLKNCIGANSGSYAMTNQFGEWNGSWATDDKSFSAQASGARIPYGNETVNEFSSIGNTACYWISSINPLYLYIARNDGGTGPIIPSNATKNYGFVVRCIKN